LARIFENLTRHYVAQAGLTTDTAICVKRYYLQCFCKVTENEEQSEYI